jgi:tetratricopeptide (TPR) repeat protein
LELRASDPLGPTAAQVQVFFSTPHQAVSAAMQAYIANVAPRQKYDAAAFIMNIWASKIALNPEQYLTQDQILAIFGEFTRTFARSPTPTPIPTLAPTPTPTPFPTISPIVESANHLHAGLEFAQEGRLDEAVDAFTEAIQLNPEDTQAYIERGQAYGNLGELQLAINDFSRAIDLDPQIADVYQHRGYAYGLLGQHQRALQDFSQAIRTGAQSAEAYFGRALAHRSLNQHKQAVWDSTQAILLNPEYGDAFFLRGLSYGLVGRPFEAQQDLERAIELDGNHAELEAAIEALQSEYSQLFLSRAQPLFSTYKGWLNTNYYETLGRYITYWEDLDWEYVSVFAATECLAGRELTSEGFLSFLRSTFRLGEELPIITAAEKASGEMVALARRRIQEGNRPAAAPCMLPYMQPLSIEKAALAIWLVQVPSYERAAPAFREAYLAGSKQSAYQWFGQSGASNPPFLLWFCQCG